MSFPKYMTLLPKTPSQPSPSGRGLGGGKTDTYWETSIMYLNFVLSQATHPSVMIASDILVLG